MVREMSKYSHFKGPFEELHDKRAQKLLKYDTQQLYYTY